MGKTVTGVAGPSSITEKVCTVQFKPLSQVTQVILELLSVNTSVEQWTEMFAHPSDSY